MDYLASHEKQLQGLVTGTPSWQPDVLWTKWGWFVCFCLPQA